MQIRGGLALWGKCLTGAVLGALVAGCEPYEMDPLKISETEKLAHTYYRMQASYTVKATGEQIDFDYVVACGGEVTHYSYTGPSVMTTHFPITMFAPTSEGAVIGVRTIDMCDGWQWENIKLGPRAGEPRVPEDLLPHTLWYPDAEDMAFAFGYETDQAYESPYSKLSFNGANVSLSDYDSWWAWRKTAEAEWEQVGMVPGPWGFNWSEEEKEFRAEVYSRGRLTGLECGGVFRVRLPDEVIEEIFALAPEGTGEFWSVQNMSDDVQLQILGRNASGVSAIWEGLQLNASYHPSATFSDYVISSSALGSMTEAGGGRVGAGDSTRKHARFADVFPVFIERPDEIVDFASLPVLLNKRTLIGSDWNGLTVCGWSLVSESDLEAYGKGETPFLVRSEIPDQTATSNSADELLFDYWIEGELLIKNLRRPQLWPGPFLIFSRSGWVYRTTE